MSPRDPITANVRAFCAMSGLGKTKVTEMIADGTLDSVLIGGRRLILVESYRRLVRAALDRASTVTGQRRPAP
jgi:hypothetical protein